MRWLAELHTFARPERPERPPPTIGEWAPGTLRLNPGLSPDRGEGSGRAPGLAGGPLLIVFIRHVGCPFAEATIRELELWRRRLPAYPIRVYSDAEPAALAKWLQEIGAAQMPARADQEIYRAWGVPVTSAAHFLGRRSLSGVLRLAARGIRNRYPSGSRWRSAALFVVGHDGKIAWRHLPAHAADLPDIAAAVARLESLMTRAALMNRAGEEIENA